MSVNLQIKDVNFMVSNEEQVKLHFIPAKTDVNSDAKVSEYFDKYTDVQGDDVMINAFRGYPLKGRKFKVPHNFTGVIFQETQRPLSDNINRIFKVSNVFNEFTYWNYDKNPSKNDALQKAFDWIDISNAMHTPISPDDLETEINKLKS